MESMNDICEEERRQHLSANDHCENETQKPTEIDHVSDSFSTVSTDADLLQHTDSTAGITTTPADKILSSTISDNPNSDLYTADNGASVVETSFNFTFTDQLASVPATSAAGSDACMAEISPV